MRNIGQRIIWLLFGKRQSIWKWMSERKIKDKDIQTWNAKLHSPSDIVNEEEFDFWFSIAKYKLFKIGDRVEFHKGGLGIVTGAYDIGCTVEWDDFKLRGNPANSDDPKKGKNISISLPVHDISPKFNPIIRKY